MLGKVTEIWLYAKIWGAWKLTKMTKPAIYINKLTKYNMYFRTDISSTPSWGSDGFPGFNTLYLHLVLHTLHVLLVNNEQVAVMSNRSSYYLQK